MKKKRGAEQEAEPVPAPQVAAILGLVTEMARQVNVNISKVNLEPIPGALLAADNAAQIAKG